MFVIDCHLPGSFLVLKEALVMQVLESGVVVVVEGVNATLMPIGPSLGWPGEVVWMHL